MSPPALQEAEGRQLLLFADAGVRAAAAADWEERRRGDEELAAFERGLRTEAGFAATTAHSMRARLHAACSAAGVPMPSRFVQTPPAIVEAIQRLDRHSARLHLHRAIWLFLTLHAERLPLDTAARLEAALDAFPGRVSPKPYLVDRDLGGSVKHVRQAPPFTAGDADRLLRTVQEHASPSRKSRDRAVAALHCWTGFAPALGEALRWEAVLPALTSGDRFPRIPTRIRDQEYPIVLDQRAVAALQAYWQASGEPARGSLFRQVNRRGKQPTTKHLRHVMAKYLKVAGLAGVDRRRLNGPFALALIERGWDAKAVADAFGYQRVRSLMEHVRPVEEFRAQLQSVEWLSAKGPDEEIYPSTDGGTSIRTLFGTAEDLPAS